MAAFYNEKTGVITLNTDNTTYQMVVGEYGFLLHLYYGSKIQGELDYLLTHFDRGFSGNPYDAGMDRKFSLDSLPQEYSCFGNGDYRFNCFQVKDSNGIYACDLRFESIDISEGKYGIDKLPAVFSRAGDKAQTVKIVLKDELLSLKVTLLYGVIEDKDVITRSVIVENCGEKEVTLGKVYSGMLDFLTGEFDVLHFHGRHGMERNLERVPVIVGNQSFGSIRGASSHMHNPMVVLADKSTVEQNGDCYGMSLLYSGNFKCEVEKDQFGQIRMGMGINDEMFEYELKSGEVFNAPEVAMTYANGFNQLSWNYHRLVRENITRGEYVNKQRPVLINNWEATYFEFDGDKIIEIAKQASELGVEMLVLDDGWFGERDSDNTGLGDWFVNEKKLGGSLSDVANKINGLGMKFGLWIEPEMISEESELFKKHPDWAFIIPGRKPVRARNQLVLDFSRKEVVDYIFDAIAKIIETSNVEYIKMDMNRNITDVYTATASAQNQGKILYEYILGVYDFLERMIARFPHLLIEGCAGGGGRFDMGMLYYTPQIWCSDNTDAIERTKIQHGTSFGYPVSTMGAHVSAVPNHQTGRITDIQTRATVAMSGTFGYELDLNKITDEEKEQVKEQIKTYKKYWSLINTGRYYRLTNPIKQRELAAWQQVGVDKNECLVSIVTLDTHCNWPVAYIKLEGLDANKEYMDVSTGKTYFGSALMNAGIPLELSLGEYKSTQIYLVTK